MQNFTKENVFEWVQEKRIRIVNFCHIPEDGRLKTLSFAVKSKKRLEEVLEFGERVDGSSLFSFIDPNQSDIYIVPRMETVFVDPFSAMPTLNILCKYLDANGKSLDIAPESILLKAERRLQSSTGIVLKALAELEFYVVYKLGEANLPEVSNKNYHESMPFAKFGDLRNEILTTLEDIGIPTKYGHAEVGGFHTANGLVMEQQEIEFLPQSLGRMAEAIAIAKWVIRNVCAKHGVAVSFSPKPALEHAGSGMHFHLCGLRKDENVVADSDGGLSIEAKQMIGGILKFASSLAAFGNAIPVSYLRFVSRKESPMYICWGSKNRLALVRIPLWWGFKRNLKDDCRRTFEFRGPDASANTHLLLAGMAMAVGYGLENPEESVRIAGELNSDKNAASSKELGVLPLSCVEAANSLEKNRGYYEADGVFPKRVIDGIMSKLSSYDDKDLWKRLADKPDEIEGILRKYLFSV